MVGLELLTNSVQIGLSVNWFWVFGEDEKYSFARKIVVIIRRVIILNKRGIIGLFFLVRGGIVSERTNNKL